MSKRRNALSGFLGVVLVATVNICSAADDSKGSAAAPPSKCEIRMPAWCIREGAQELVSQFSREAAYPRVWIARGFFHPQRPLVVLEPYGCREGLSDMLAPLGFDEGITWNERSWNRIRVRLKGDGSCDLELLVPYFDDEQSGEAFFGGAALIQACTTTACAGPSLGSVRGEFEAKWRTAKRPTASPSILAGGAASDGAAQAETEAPRAISPSKALELPPDVLKAYERAALDGDGKVAFRVFLHYSFAAPHEDQSHRWALVAAENGSWQGMARVAQSLISTRKDDSCRRAQFWIKRARQTLAAAKSNEGDASMKNLDSELRASCPKVVPESLSPAWREEFG